jgi:hypothetical protein
VLEQIMNSTNMATNILQKLAMIAVTTAVIPFVITAPVVAVDFNISGTLESLEPLEENFSGAFFGTFSVLDEASFSPIIPGGPITAPLSDWDITITRDGNFFSEIRRNQNNSIGYIDVGIAGEEIFIFQDSINSLFVIFPNPPGNIPLPQNLPSGPVDGFITGGFYNSGRNSALVTNPTVTFSSPTSVPESSSALGLLTFGAFGAGLLLKHKQRKATAKV